MFAGSFESQSQIIRTKPNFYPQIFTLRNYAALLRDDSFLRWTINSIIITACGTFIAVLVSCLSGYAFAKMEFPGRNIIFWTLLATIMIPYHVTFVPLFITIKDLGLYDTYPAVFLPQCACASSMFMARQFISTIPSELIQAAKIDGASEFQIFWKIIMPSSKSLIGVLSILISFAIWTNYYWPLIMTRTDKARTLSVGVVALACGGANLQNIGIAMAGASLIAMPLYILFFCFSRVFLKGIQLGGIYK